MKSWLLILSCCLAFDARALAAPALTDPALRVEEVVSGLALPTTMAFIGDNGILVLQKNDGKVRRVVDGVLQSSEVLDLAVDSASEHGLLGIALHPDFAENGFVYLYYTASSTQNDNGGAAANRVDKFHWDGSALTAEPGNPILSLPVTPGPNHNGGIILFGPDGTLYVINGDLNRNGKVQNFANGGDPDNTSGIYRLNGDGTAASGNPFSAQGAPLDKYFAYGIRNSFGMAFDPVTNKLWDTENGPNSYDEINLVEPGFNSGWESIMGPDSRNAANAPEDLFVVPGSHYADPKFSWFNTVGPTAIVFLNSTELGAQYENDVFVGDVNNGRIYHFVPNTDRNGFDLGSLTDQVVDSPSELTPFIFGTGFGAGFQGVTDLKVGPDGFLYVVSISGSIYRIVPGDPPLTIGALSLPDAEAGVPYSADLNISGGADPYAITALGLLPQGISPNGVGLGGTPNAAKKFKFTLQVIDDDGAIVRRQFSLNVLKPVAISTPLLKNGRIGRSYKAALKAKGGKAPYTWEVTSGVLPSWAHLDPATGAISGTPSVPDSQSFTITVTDFLGGSDSQDLTLTSN
jgi:glucose/arabinose dehydrogenase